jgi:hypothetical protein
MILGGVFFPNDTFSFPFLSVQKRGGLHHPDSMIEKEKHLIDQLNADHARGAVVPDAFSKSTYSLCFYDSLLMIEKGDVWRKEADAIGSWDREFPRPEMRVGS